LVCVHHLGVAAVTTSGVDPRRVSIFPKINLIGVENDAVRIVWIYRDTLIIPILVVIVGATAAIDERRSGRAGNLPPSRSAVRAPPCRKFATGPAATRLCLDCLHLRVNDVWIARRNCDVDTTQFIRARAGAD